MIIEKFKEKLEILIPIICIIFWEFVVFIIIGLRFFEEGQGNLLPDFLTFYQSGKYIFTDPHLIYTEAIQPSFYYLPSFASLFNPISLLPYTAAKVVWLIILTIFGILFVIEFYKILKLKGIDKNIRFLLLLLISNGLCIYRFFVFTQPKIIVIFILLFVLRREIEFDEEKKEKFSFFILNTFLLIIVLGMMMYFVLFILFIYLFHNISLKKIFNQKQLKKYFACIVIFLCQNFMFIIQPSLIFDFIGGSTRIVIGSPTTLAMLFTLLNVDISTFSLQLKLFSYIIMIIITLILIVNQDVELEYKFAYMALFTLMFNMFLRQNGLIVLYPLICLLFINFEFEGTNLLKPVTFIKKNLAFCFVFLCFAIIYIFSEIGYLFKIELIESLIPI